jgi:hypothetical protein
MSNKPYSTVCSQEKPKSSNAVSKISSNYSNHEDKKDDNTIEICDLRYLSKAYIREGIESASITREGRDITEEYLELIFPSSLRKLNIDTVGNMIKLNVSACDKLE